MDEMWSWKFEESMDEALTPTQTLAPSVPIDNIPDDPVDFVTATLGYTLDPMQAEIVRSQARKIILLMGRRCGKTFATAAKVAHFALKNPGADTLVFAPTEDQSRELLNYVRSMYWAAGIPFKGQSSRSLYIELPNRSRIKAIATIREANVRGFTPRLVVMDEAAAISDDIYNAITPMLGIHNPAIILLSTPRATQGYFYRSWISDDPWQRFISTTVDCPRYSREHIEWERRNKSEHEFRRELMCEFQQVDGACFLEDLVKSAFTTDNFQILPRMASEQTIFIACDLGQLQNHSAFIVLERLRIYSNVLDPITRAYPEYDEYRVLQVERVPLHTPYPAVAEMLLALTRKWPNSQIVIDAGGVGVPVLDHLRSAKPNGTIHAVQITAASNASYSGDFHRVPKRDAIAAIQLMLQTHSLKLSTAIPNTNLLKEELRMFRHRYSKRNADLFTAPDGEQDDLVMALAIAAHKAWRNL
jgi:hypothetical protein